MNAQTRNDHRRIIRSIWLGFGIGIALLIGLRAHGEDTAAVFPDAPKPQRATKETPKEHAIRMSVLSSLAGANLGDVITTERCNGLQGCREGSLPLWISNSPVRMSGYAAGKLALEWFASNKLARKHPKLAIAGDLLSSGYLWSIVGNNIALQAGRPAKTAKKLNK